MYNNWVGLGLSTLQVWWSSSDVDNNGSAKPSAASSKGIQISMNVLQFNWPLLTIREVSFSYLFTECSMFVGEKWLCSAPPSFVSKFLSMYCNAYISVYPARALRALGLLLADGAPTVGGGKTF